ncbi:MAG: ATP-binding cassette domain-containing protein, partial [Bradymonadaceae bacterium]
AVAAEGEVRVDGVDPFERRAEIAERMAYVPQIAPEFSVRVGRLTETVCRAREIEPARVAEVTERLDFALDRHRDKPYRDLSGGMKQKVSIGLALAGDPDLLVMDEPTASLDAPTRSSFFVACAELDGP